MPNVGSNRGSALIADLESRGLVHDTTDRAALAERLDAGPTPADCGFDPTADSLHIGNLQSILLLRRFQEASHPPIALVGGATGMIGDPSGRSDERQFLDTEVLDANRVAIGAQLGRFLDLDGGSAPGGALVDNRTWTEPMGVLDFLRDVGKHLTVNTMMAKDSVKSRLDRESGISFTEFSYMLLQANDFLELHQRHGCDLQVAGSDQWGNITAGIDLVRRRTGDHVHGLTAPLIVRADGSKFGKSEGQNVWLSAERTSPFQLYQYFLNVADDDVEPFLLRLTLVDVETCRSVAEAHRAEPGRREGQRRLARELTALVHGAETIGPIESAAGVVFAGERITDADPAALELLASELPTSTISAGEFHGADPIELVVRTELGKSKGEVRRNLQGYSVNQINLATRGDAPLGADDLLHGRFVLVQRGRKAHHLVVVEPA